jgi:hypothetical protein
MKMIRTLIIAIATLTTAISAEKPPPPDAIRIELNDGKIIYPKSMRRDGDVIRATITIPPAQPGGPVTEGEFGWSVKDVFRLFFPKPAVLDTAPDLIAAGRAEEALKKLDQDIKYFGGFRDAPGSWWPDLVPLQIQALLVLKKEKEAADVAEQYGRLGSTEDFKQFTKAFTAVARTRKGEHTSALYAYTDAIRSTKRPDILSLIAVNKGDSLLALADELKAKHENDKAEVRYEEALLSYMRIAALYPSQRMFQAQATLGAARAYFGFEDFERALISIKELRENFAGTSEATATNELEQKIIKRKEQLADPDAEKATKEGKPADPEPATTEKEEKPNP